MNGQNYAVDVLLYKHNQKANSVNTFIMVKSEKKLCRSRKYLTIG